MDSPFLGVIVCFGCNFAPRGWAICAGQIISIASNTALFSLLGTYYGGNGQTTFALPDLRGRVPLSEGQGLGLSDYSLGQRGGQESVSLISQEMPAHSHAVQVNNASGSLTAPASLSSIANYADLNGDGGQTYLNNTVVNVTLAPASVSIAGGNQPHNNIQPILVMNYCIAIQGVFPARN